MYQGLEGELGGVRGEEEGGERSKGGRGREKRGKSEIKGERVE